MKAFKRKPQALQLSLWGFVCQVMFTVVFCQCDEILTFIFCRRVCAFVPSESQISWKELLSVSVNNVDALSSSRQFWRCLLQVLSVVRTCACYELQKYRAGSFCAEENAPRLPTSYHDQHDLRCQLACKLSASWHCIHCVHIVQQQDFQSLAISCFSQDLAADFALSSQNGSIIQKMPCQFCSGQQVDFRCKFAC